MIIGVAIRNKNLIIQLPKPNRHCDCFKYAFDLGLDIETTGIGMKAKHQGFYTNSGRYLDRAEALKYVQENPQSMVKNADFLIGGLFSEDLW